MKFSEIYKRDISVLKFINAYGSFLLINTFEMLMIQKYAIKNLLTRRTLGLLKVDSQIEPLEVLRTYEKWFNYKNLLKF